jgi:hypothetical protein
MDAGLRIRVVDPDADYLGIEIHAWNTRFCGTTLIYAGLDELSEFASCIAGFPTSSQDERAYKFGTADPGVAGHCSLRFHCVDMVGHSALEIALEDDDHRMMPGTAKFSFLVNAADIDRFTRSLHEVERLLSGEALLAMAF